METVFRSCPDPEALAAWLDRGVDAAERAQIEAHLATCDDCRAIVAGVIETQNAVAEAPPAVGMATAVPQRARVIAFPGKKVLWGAVSALAAAAVLVLAVDVPMRLWPAAGGGTASKLADLAAAVRDERTVEARLTGGFSHGPLRAAVRSGGSSAASDNWTLLAAAGKIREDATASPTAVNLHALGVAHLLLGEFDQAVTAFEDAIAESPRQAQYYSDIAAAYLARGRQLDRPDDFPRALDAAERALRADEALLEARFNRALALEAMSLSDQARAAWEDYLSRDSTSGWASEARNHLQRLQQAPSSGDMARNNSPPQITEMSVEAALDWLLRHGLPRLADAVLHNDTATASREHLHLTHYAQQIATASGDRFAVAVVEENLGASGERAEALRTFARGLIALDSDDPAAAEAAFVASCDGAGQAVGTLCEIQLGAIDVVQRRDADAERRLAEAARVATAQEWTYAINQAKRLAGYRLMYRGDYAGVVSPYAEAFQSFQAARYLSSACVLAVQLADFADVVGVSDHGWRWRLRALDLAHSAGAPACAQLLKLQLPLALANQRLDAAASVVAGPVDPLSMSNVAEARRVVFAVVKGRIALAADDRPSLRQSVDPALEVAERSRDFRAQRVAADLLALRGILQHRDGQLAEAHATLTMAIGRMGPERAAARAAALLARASVAADDPQGSANAEADIESALRLLESRMGNTPAQPLRLEEAAVAFQAISTLLERQDRSKATEDLWLVERLRQVLNGAPTTFAGNAVALDAALASLSPKTVVVSYLLSKESVFAWVRTGDGWQLVHRPVPPSDVTQLLNTLTVQINRTPTREDLWRPTLSRLYDLLLRGLPGIGGATEIAIVPDGVLNRVPFGSLFDTERNSYLFEHSAVRVSPNLAFIPAGSTVTEAPVSAAVIGDPRVTGVAARRFRSLPRARAEALRVARLYPRATVVVDDAATKARVLDALSEAEVVHYAGHAVAGMDGQGARLLLAGDVGDPRAGLAPSDIAGRRTRMVRVVLAACETGAASVDRAAGMSSLSTALLRAGALSVVATLWNVDDAAGELFFASVHRALAAGQSTAAAVAGAQRACRASTDCRRAAGIWVGTSVYGAN